MSGSPALVALLTALERRPETDPRNPNESLALSRAARRLVGLEGAARASVAAGRSPAETQLGLETAERADDAEAFAERYRATAAALQELREWLQDLVLPTGAHYATALRLQQLGRARRLGSGLPAVAGRCGHRTAAPVRAMGRGPAGPRPRRGPRPARGRPGHEGDGRGPPGAGPGRYRPADHPTEPASTEAGVYVGLDLGVLYPPELDRASLYVGANLYFRPINKRASLRSRGSFAHRFSLTVGISLNNLKLEEGDPRFEALLGDDSNLLVGAGLRLSRSLRLSSGALLFLKNDPNPLVSDRSLAATFYVAVSLDVDIVRAFRSMGE